MPSGFPTVPFVPAGRLTASIHGQILYSDVAQTIDIPVKKGTRVIHQGASLVKPTEFDAVTPSLKIGVVDGSHTDDDLLLNNTSAALATQSNPTTSDGIGGVPAIAANGEVGINGYQFQTDGKITVTWAPGTGGTKGQADIQIVYGVASNDGVTV